MAFLKSNPILIFVDLDDTIFQTKRKNEIASIPATVSNNPLTVSYMSDEQNALLELLVAHNSSVIIPVTARDHDQYYRTKISQDVRVNCASLCFGAEILINNEFNSEWSNHIFLGLKACSISIGDLFFLIENKLDKAEFIVRNVNDYYIVIKHIKRNDYEIANKECFALLSQLIPHDFNLYQNDNNISIVPKCIDKRNAVEFLIQKHEPKLTIGIGDSLSDWNFMDLCDYKIIPKLSQINKIINLHIPK